MSNVGEIDEPRVIERLVSMKGKNIEGIGRIDSVADYRGVEYPSGIEAHIIQKAPPGAKRDAMINGLGYSIKSNRAAPAAIVNHTTREKWMRVCRIVGVSIGKLDEMVDDYWKLRFDGIIGEDTRISDRQCPFNKNPKYWELLLSYFLFIGTGTKDSKYPASYILETKNPYDPGSWTIINREDAFEALWPNLVFSLRAKKGMPPNYPHMSDTKKKSDIEPWVKYIDGDFRGALHIRAR